jgi:hypothetical protein
MGNSVEHVGYACELPAMIKSWRSQWCAPSDAIFGVATLAAGGSEGHDRSMASMRFAQTASYGVLPNALLPRTFVAQVYDLGDPWASVGDGGSDAQNCSKVDPTTGRYGPNCSKWDAAEWSPGVAAYAPLVRKNAPSGVPGNNFMGGIHPRLKRPVGRRLAVAAAALRNGTVLTGPTIAGCSATSVDGATTALTIHFNKTLLGDDAVVVQTRSQCVHGVQRRARVALPSPVHSAAVFLPPFAMRRSRSLRVLPTSQVRTQRVALEVDRLTWRDGLPRRCGGRAAADDMHRQVRRVRELLHGPRLRGPAAVVRARVPHRRAVGVREILQSGVHETRQSLRSHVRKRDVQHVRGAMRVDAAQPGAPRRRPQRGLHLRRCAGLPRRVRLLPRRAGAPALSGAQRDDVRVSLVVQRPVRWR